MKKVKFTAIVLSLVVLIQVLPIGVLTLAATKSISLPSNEIVYDSGEITFTCTNTGARDWIAIYPADETSVYEYWDYRYCTSPTFPSNNSVDMRGPWPYPVGDYYALLLENDGYTAAYRYDFKVVPGTDMDFVLPKTEFSVSDSLDFTIYNTDAEDYITIYKKGYTSYSEFLHYSKLSGSTHSVAASKFGAGEYVAILFDGEGNWTEKKKISFKIVNDAFEIDFSLSKTVFGLSEDIPFTCVNTDTSDYICVFPKGYTTYNDRLFYGKIPSNKVLKVGAGTLPVGSYVAILFDGEGNWTEKKKLDFEVVESTLKKMTIADSSLRVGENIELTYNNTDGTESIGIYKKGFSNYGTDRLLSTYCSKGTEFKASFSTANLEPGEYVAFLFEPGWVQVANCSFTVEAGNKVYVSENGSDTGNGTEKSPFKTIERAVTHFDGQNATVVLLDSATYDVATEYAGEISIVGKIGSERLYYGGGDMTLLSNLFLDNLVLTQDSDNAVICTNSYSLKLGSALGFDKGEYAGYDNPSFNLGARGSEDEKIVILGGGCQNLTVAPMVSNKVNIYSNGVKINNLMIESSNQSSVIKAIIDGGEISAVTIPNSASFASLQIIAKNGAIVNDIDALDNAWLIKCENSGVYMTDTVGTYNTQSPYGTTPVAVDKDGKVYVAEDGSANSDSLSTNYLYNNFTDFINYRKPLVNTYKKLTEEKKLNIVYFGGSVTSGYGSTNAMYSWRGLSEAWFKRTFPDAAITTVDTSIGESGTFLGTYRVKEDVIGSKPDLLFIEYAINDKYKNSDEDTSALQYETIIREVKQALPDCDIVTLLVTDKSASALYPELFPQAKGHEKIAALYNIPTVNVGHALIASMEDRTSATEWTKYFIDIVHPTNAGYGKYYECLEEYLKNSLLCTDYSGAEVERHNMLPVQSKHLLDGDRKSLIGNLMTPYISDSYGFSYSENMYFGPTQTPHMGYYYANSSTTDAYIEFTFTGTELAVWTNFYKSSTVKYSVDGGEYMTISCDNHAPTQLVSGLTAGEHTVKIYPVTYASDTNGVMKIGAIFTRNASKETKQGAVFNYTDVYSGKLTLPAGSYNVEFAEGNSVASLNIPAAAIGMKFVGWRRADGEMASPSDILVKGEVLEPVFEEIGDVTGDGRINVKDLIRVAKEAAKPENEASPDADLTGDGKVNALDLAELKRILLNR